jgi:hypothetical protein
VDNDQAGIFLLMIAAVIALVGGTMPDESSGTYMAMLAVLGGDSAIVWEYW